MLSPPLCICEWEGLELLECVAAVQHVLSERSPDTNYRQKSHTCAKTATWQRRWEHLKTNILFSPAFWSPNASSETIEKRQESTWGWISKSLASWDIEQNRGGRKWNWRNKWRVNTFSVSQLLTQFVAKVGGSQFLLELNESRLKFMNTYRTLCIWLPSFPSNLVTTLLAMRVCTA